MIPDPSQPDAQRPAVDPEPRGRSLVWQLIQIGVLTALLLAGMYEVDLDARALAERRARPAFLQAIEEASRRGSANAVDPELDRAIEAYQKVCGECASRERCGDAVRLMRETGKTPPGRGPCKTAIFDRGNLGESPGGSRGP